MLHSLKIVLERLPRHDESYDLVFALGSKQLTIYTDIAWEDIQGMIEDFCYNNNYAVITILWDLDLRYYLLIELKKV
jgi:hypothetical protein